MSRQTFLGIFLIILGVLGIVAGIATHHISESVSMLVLYLLPAVVGVIMILVDRVGK